MRKLFFIIAITGWTITLGLHLTTLFVDYNISSQIPFIWLLIPGVFIVWTKTVFIMRDDKVLDESRQTSPLDFAKHIKFLKKVFNHNPLATIAAIGFINAIINFIVIISIQPYTPEIKDGIYVLENHGHFIKTITEAEYNHYSALQLMLYTGHGIAVYGIAAAVLFQKKSRTSTEEN